MSSATRLLTLANLRALFAVSRHTLYRWWKSGRMPVPRRLGNRLVWREDVIAAWIDGLPEAGPRRINKRKKEDE